MKLMVIGGGGREHAIIKKLKENPAIEEIYCLPGNGGIAADAVCVSEIGAKDIPAQVEFAKAHGIDYAVVAPDDPLALGAVDALTEAGIPCFGPDKKAAVIEASKAFSKDLIHDRGQGFRPERCARCHRRIYGRPRGLRSELYRR